MTSNFQRLFAAALLFIIMLAFIPAVADTVFGFGRWVLEFGLFDERTEERLKLVFVAVIGIFLAIAYKVFNK